jgi:hypothetical protein
VSQCPVHFTVFNSFLVLALSTLSFLFHHGAFLGERVVLAGQNPNLTPAVLTEVFRDFSQSLEANAEVTPLLGHNHFLSNDYSPITKITKCCIV